MAATEHAPVPLDQRVEKMDMELKAHFDEMRAFTVHALEGLEHRLGDRIGGVESELRNVKDRLLTAEGRLDTIEDTMRIGFQAMDGQLVEIRRILLSSTSRRTTPPARAVRTSQRRRRARSRR